jgi:hypothetical protein|tara:strand:+ start:2061 stop:2345 length:285 start_codon:yes stop_codon:yes gene_type:complete
MRFNYKIINIDYHEFKINIKYWCEGMTSYNGKQQLMDFNIETIKNITEKEFDMRVYKYVENDFKRLLRTYEDYKNGKYDALENIAKSTRSIDVV